MVPILGQFNAQKQGNHLFCQMPVFLSDLTALNRSLKMTNVEKKFRNRNFHLPFDEQFQKTGAL